MGWGLLEFKEASALPVSASVLCDQGAIQVKVLYVTSFIPTMYSISARNLISSFQATKSGGTMLLCHEGFYEGPMPGHPTCQLPKFPDGFLSWDLGESVWLKDWLEMAGNTNEVVGAVAYLRRKYDDIDQLLDDPNHPRWPEVRYVVRALMPAASENTNG